MRKPDDPTASTDARPDGDGDLSFYGRWSRRKRAARHGAEPAGEARPAPAPAATATAPAAGDDGAPPADGTPRERVLTDADMPPLESLGEDDDYSGFLSPGVSETLRKQALRKLFTSPRYNVVDGLDDYAEDFTRFEPLGDIVTSDMRHRIEVEAERAQREAEARAQELLDDGTAHAADGAHEANDADTVDGAPGAQPAPAAVAGSGAPAPGDPRPGAGGAAAGDRPRGAPGAGRADEAETPRDV